MGKRFHFVGIGGISMCGLAALAATEGHTVTGSDRTENSQTRRLRAAGIPITIGHDIFAAREADALVYTAAIPPTDPELVVAQTSGVPCISRAAYLGQVMRGYNRRIGVAGVHGKSTVTGMLAAILAAANTNATVLCGAVLDGETPYRIGGRETLLFEACEYRDSFLAFSPTVALLLNLEWEHVDYFKTEAQMAKSFVTYAAGAHTVVANADDPRLMEALAGVQAVTYGFDGGVYTARGCEWYRGDEHLGTLHISVPGRHNLQNALAAATTAHVMSIPTPAILAGLAAFGGVNRRMTYRGTLNGARVYDDYAHHPTEVAASLAAAREICHGNLICVFQSHTYSRTAAFADTFCKLFEKVDHMIFAPIYAAREENTTGITAETLASRVQGAIVLVPNGELAAHLAEVAHTDDVVLIMGAGDIDGVFRYLTLAP